MRNRARSLWLPLVAATLCLAFMISTKSYATPYVVNSGWQQLSFVTPSGPLDLFNEEGAFTFVLAAPFTNAVITLSDVGGGVERFEAFNFGSYIGPWTPPGSFATQNLSDGSYELTFRIQQWNTVAPDIASPQTWLAQFRVDATVIPEPNTALLVLTGLLGLAYRQRRQGRAA